VAPRARRKLRFGYADPGIHGRVTPDLLMRQSRVHAMATGADSLWVPDHVMGVIPRSVYTPAHIGLARVVRTLDACYEPWVTLGHLAARNRLARLRLGVALTDTARRNPAVTAQAAATLHQLSRGRAILGIGTGEAMNNTPYGTGMDRPVTVFEEGLATIRALWESEGEPVSRDSPVFPLRDALFAIPPYRGRYPEIWVGAHGPRMLRATGRHADGWLPGLTMDPLEFGKQLAEVRAGASDAGRSPDAVLPAKYFFVVTGRSGGEVEEALGTVGVRSYALCAPAEYWARHGAEHPLGPAATGAQDLLPQTLGEQEVLAAVERVPPSLMRSFVLAGTPAEILDQLADWRDQGLAYPVLMNMGVLHPSLVRGLRSMLPFTQVLRGIRRL
jgi:phthiodiolone/phenolphthiodiolone dimycocerosates ketoreductase